MSTERLAAFLASACYRGINAILWMCAFSLWPRKRPSQAKRVCIYRIGNIGDIACALPAIYAVRRAYPDAHLTLLSSPGMRGKPSAADVLDGVTWIDELRIYHADDISTAAGRLALLFELRQRKFDVWLDLPDDLTSIWRQFRNMVFARLTGVRWARGWRVSTLRWAARAQSNCLSFPNEVERNLAIVNDAGIATNGVEFALPRSTAVQSRIERLLGSSALDSRPLVVIAPGTSRSTNRWPPERFVEVGHRLSAAGFRVVVVGGRSDVSMSRSIVARIGGNACSFAGDLSVAESCELLRRCELAVCLDSCAQHLASAVGTPVVSLFSAWQMRGKWHPYGPRNVAIRKKVPCDTCLLDECPNGNRCMKAIEVEEVITQALKTLAYRLPAAGSLSSRILGEISG